MASEGTPATNIPPPTLGQHTGEILTEFGYSAEEMDALREYGAI